MTHIELFLFLVQPTAGGQVVVAAGHEEGARMWIGHATNWPSGWDKVTVTRLGAATELVKPGIQTR